MLYGARGRRGPSASASAPVITPSRSVGAGAKAAREPVNILLSKYLAFKCPPRFEQLLQTLLPQSTWHGGLSGSFAWVAFDDANSNITGQGIKLAWWKYGRDGILQDGVVSIHATKSLDSLRSVVFYHISVDGVPVPSIAVADSEGFAIYRFGTPGAEQCMFRDWEGLKMKPGDHTVLEVCADGYIIGCNTRELLFILHDTGAKSSLDLEAWMEHITLQPSFFQRILGSVLSSSDIAAARVRGMIVSKRGIGFGHEFDVFTLTGAEIHKWHVTTGTGSAHVEHEKSRTKLEGGGRLLDLQMQRICGSEGRWFDSRLVVLSANAESCAIIVYFLSLEDLSTIRMEHFPAVPDLWGGGLTEEHLRLLPLTMAAARSNLSSNTSSETPNIHISDGSRLFSIRCDGTIASSSFGRGKEWYVGPAGRIFGWGPVEEDGRRQAEMLLLMADAVYLIQPTEEEEIQARTALDDGGLLKILQNAVTLNVNDVFYNLQQNSALKEELDFIEEQWKTVDPSPLSDQQQMICTALVGALRKLAVNREMDAATAEVLDRRLCERFIQESEQRLNDYAMALDGLGLLDINRFPILQEALAFFMDRLRSTRKLFEEAKLSPGSLLSEAIEAVVSRPDWDGENRLRPWATAWKIFCGNISKAECVLADVCLCIKRKMDEFAIPGMEQEQVVQYIMEGAQIFESFSRHLLSGPRPLVSASLRGGVTPFHSWSHDTYFPQSLLKTLALDLFPPLMELAFRQCQAMRRSSLKGRALLENRLFQLQQLHLRLLKLLNSELPTREYYNRRHFYVECWAPEIFDVQANRISLAEEFEDVDALVHISLYDLGGRELQERFQRDGVWKPDQWATVFGARRAGGDGSNGVGNGGGGGGEEESYATRLFRGLCEQDVEQLWQPPFHTYDFVEELQAFVARRAAAAGTGGVAGWGAGNLRWVVDMRCEELSRILGPHASGGGAGGTAARRAREERLGRVIETCRELSLERPAEAPNAHCTQALLGVAGVAAEALRRARGSPATRPPRDVAAGLLAARVQSTTLRRGGGGGRASQAPLSLEGTVRECVDRARSSSEPEAARRLLLREAMTLLGHWDLGAEKAPPAVWQRLLEEAMEVAAAVADREIYDELWDGGDCWDAIAAEAAAAAGEESAMEAEVERQLLMQADAGAGQTGQRFDRRLCHEALHGAGPEDGGWDLGAAPGARPGMWPRDTVQYEFLLRRTGAA